MPLFPPPPEAYKEDYNLLVMTLVRLWLLLTYAPRLVWRRFATRKRP